MAMAATYRHEFGTVREDGGVVTHTFTLPAGKTATGVINAFPGCPCVSVDYPKRPVKAGEPLKIVLKYDPERQKGHFTKSVYLRLTGDRRDTLVVTGTIKRNRPLIDVAGYPADFGLGLRLDRYNIDFGTMRPGTSKTLTIPMVNGYDAVMGLDLQPSGRDSTLLFVPYGLKLGPGAKSKIQVTLSVPEDYNPSGQNATTPDLYLMPLIHSMEVDSIPVKVRISR